MILKKMRCFGHSLLLSCFVLALAAPALADDAATGRIHLGVGVGAFRSTVHIPGNTETFRAWTPGYSFELGYAPWLWLETGFLLTGGGSRADSLNGKTVRIKLDAFPQWYLRTRIPVGDQWGLYGQIAVGSDKLEQRNAAGTAILSERIASLSAGGGISWRFSPRYSLDTGVFRLGIPLQKRNSGLSTSTLGITTTLNYAFGSLPSPHRAEPEAVASEDEDQPLPVAPEPESVASEDQPLPVAPEPHDEADATRPVMAVTGGRDEHDVLLALESWRHHWSAMDTAGYFQAYAAHFTPRTLSMIAWKHRKQRLFNSKKYIHVKISETKVEILEQGKRVRVRFRQQYESNNFNSLVRKTLLFEKQDNEWKITHVKDYEKKL